DNIVFKVGNISLPAAAGANVISPLSFFGEEATTDNVEVLNLVRFIMSAGEVGGDGKIKIGANPFGGREGIFDDDLWNTLLNEGEITVSESEAKEHLEETLLKAYSGDYSGTWSGTAHYPGENLIQTSGTWKIEIAENAQVVGSYTGTFDGETIGGNVTGEVDPNGNTDLGANGQAGGIVVWSGKIDLANGTMAGDYSGDYEKGTFAGKKIN
ncbi:MAG: hypothetical protein LBL05_04105, partial [Synergistaceae bacterium]|nr:hypothetical protein [Synergistaceae bacterium]